MTGKILRITLRAIGALLSAFFGLYPVLYFINDGHFRLRGTKSAALLASALWNAGFYTHITCAGIALLIGWLQFSNQLRIRRPAIHRNIGKAYLVAAVAGGLAGTGISFKATGGLIPALGFFTLGVIWVAATVQGYRLIRAGSVPAHRVLMIYSYACCFAAVMLRLWLVGLGLFLPFSIAYPIVAWLCWVPNLIVARLIVARISRARALPAGA